MSADAAGACVTTCGGDTVKSGVGKGEVVVGVGGCDVGSGASSHVASPPLHAGMADIAASSPGGGRAVFVVTLGPLATVGFGACNGGGSGPGVGIAGVIVADGGDVVGVAALVCGGTGAIANGGVAAGRVGAALAGMVAGGAAP